MAAQLAEGRAHHRSRSRDGGGLGVRHHPDLRPRHRGRVSDREGRHRVGRAPAHAGVVGLAKLHADSEAAVVAGLSSAGVDVYRVGVLPTPAIAYLVSESGADLGVMLSASHNPMPDNGIKLFARGGGKLDDAIEDQIQNRMEEPWERPVGKAVGRVIVDSEAANRYLDYLNSTVTTKLAGIKVVVDCANGAASFVAPEALRRAGAEVIAVANTPDGWNINDGVGSTHLDFLKTQVKEHGADLGIAHDGDADRCLAVDSEGNEVDGDQIIAILATGMHSRGELANETVVATVMSNFGFLKAMQEAGIKVEVTSVGDRYVLEKMLADDLSLGGEQSGHVINRKFANTGDGEDHLPKVSVVWRFAHQDYDRCFHSRARGIVASDVVATRVRAHGAPGL